MVPLIKQEEKVMKKTSLLVFGALAFCATAALMGCNSNASKDSNIYEIKQNYNESNKADMPADAVNYVMFAYSTEEVNVNFNTKLTLNKEEKSYVLYKQIVTPETKDEEGNTMVVVNAEYEFKGTYVGDGNELTLKIPSEAKYSCAYPTVLNYQSIEKQTQGWVDVKDAPFILTRFNKWYPAKNSGTLDQNVTLNGKTLTFAEVTFQEETPNEDQPNDEPNEKTPKISVTGNNGAAKLDFFEDKTYTWSREAGGNTLSESGDWKFEEGEGVVMTLSITQDGELKGSISSTLDESNNLVIEYIPIVTGGSYAEMLKETFVMAPAQFGQLYIIK